jgi:hypothetical protein
MAVNGVITQDKLKDILYQRQIINDVLIASQSYGSLMNPAIIKRVAVNGTKVSLSTMDAVTIATDLREFEASNVQSPDFGSVDVDLYADEMRIAFSDEALMNPTIADPMSLAKANAAVGFAYKLDYKIGTALDLTPTAGAAWDITAASFLDAVADAVGKLAPYRITGIACGAKAYGQIMSSVNSGDYRVSGMTVQNGINILPGYNVPIIMSTVLDSIDNDSIYFVSNEAPGAYLFEGQYKARVYDDPDTRSTILQANVWNAVKSNIRQSNNTNKGVVETAITIPST